MKIEFLGNIILRGKIEVLTGLHIGGSKEKLEIGGVDSPVIRDPYTQYPYIPGSSLKGKLRALLSYDLNLADDDPPKRTDFNNPLIRIFGVSADSNAREGIGPTRLIVRDAYPDKPTIEMWKILDSELMFTEYKPENNINRITSAANPRFMERVVKGSVFNIEFVYGFYKVEGIEKQDKEFFSEFIKALRLLEHSTLGGSGSRGYGKVAFKFMEPFVLLKKDYIEGSESFKNTLVDLDKISLTNHLRLSDLTQQKINDILSKFN